MSKIGRQLITIPTAVEVSINGNLLLAQGKKGNLSLIIPDNLIVEIIDSKIKVSKNNDQRDLNKIWGLIRSKIANMIEGVNNGFVKSLELIGVGFKASFEGSKLILDVGFTNKVELNIPKSIQILINKNIISVAGIDKELVGEIAANIRAVKKPEPYKGSGIRYLGEVIKKKAGKKAATATK